MGYVQLQFRKGTAIEWTTSNPILADAEIGVELNTGLFKVGSNSTPWNSLPYMGSNLGPNFPYTGSALISGSLGITGPAYGNIQSLTVTSNTASINLSTGNFFTVTLEASGTTHLNVTNVEPGYVANILVSTNTASTASFSSNIRQESGSLYTPSTSGSRDVLTLISWDTASAYLAHIKRLV
jgi:hypothetical protein